VGPTSHYSNGSDVYAYPLRLAPKPRRQILKSMTASQRGLIMGRITPALALAFKPFERDSALLAAEKVSYVDEVPLVLTREAFLDAMTAR
jgi:hypothetical protein